MNLDSYLLYALFGKLLIFFVQAFPLSSLPLIGSLFKEERFFGKLVSCDLCLGTWIYIALAFLFSNYVYLYVPVFSEFILGMLTSLVVHLASLGWKTKFGVFIME